MTKLEIQNLHVEIAGKKILKGISLAVNEGEIHAIMGPNGSGKSTLAAALMGHPGYAVTSGSIKLGGVEITKMQPDERARLGLFLAFQYPMEVAGVTVSNFLRTAYNSLHENNGGSISPLQFNKLLKEKLQLLKMDDGMAQRYLNDGFSGGEKKRCEILQMSVLQPRFAVLDEIDSGLDIDAVRIVSEGVNAVKKGTGMGTLLITHYQRILKYVRPDVVHVLVDGRIVKTGGAELADELEAKGYEWLLPRDIELKVF